MIHRYFIFITVFIFFGSSHAQVTTNSELYKTFQKKDSIVFDAGFNNCDLTALAAELTDDLEFYHDQGGIQNKEQFLDAMRRNICSSPQ